VRRTTIQIGQTLLPPMGRHGRPRYATGAAYQIFDNRGQLLGNWNAVGEKGTFLLDRVAGLVKIVATYRAGNDVYYGEAVADFSANDRYSNEMRLQRLIAQPTTVPVDVRTHVVVGVRQGKNALEGVVVQLADAHGRLLAAFASDGTGQVRFEHIPAGQYLVSIRGTSIHQLVTVDDKASGGPDFPLYIPAGVRVSPLPPSQLGSVPNLVPGIYVLARDLDVGVVHEVGRHQLLVLVPQNRRTVSGLLNLGHGVSAVVFSALKVNGELKMMMANQPLGQADLQAARDFVAGVSGHYRPEAASVGLSDPASVDRQIQRLIQSANYYNTYEAAHPIAYPPLGGALDPRNCLNSNSWAQSIVEYVIGPRRVLEDFTGNDVCNTNRIDRRYFGV
jgi:hypothetical protein